MPAILLDILLTALGGMLVAAVGYLLKGRFDQQDRAMEAMRLTQAAHSVALAGLLESQRAVVRSQSQLSSVHDKLINDAEDLEEVTDQLQLATQRLRDRMDAHDRFQHLLRGQDPD